MGKLVVMVIILLVSTSVFFGCQEKKGSEELVEFSMSIKLEGEAIGEIPIYTNENVYMSVMDTFLVILTPNEKFFKIYSTESYQLLGEFGSAGEGPSDFNLPVLSKEIWNSGETPLLRQVYDMRLNRHYSVSLLDAMDGVAFEGNPVGETSSQILNFHFKTEDYLWCTSVNQKGRFLHHNYKTGEAKVIPYIPETDFPIDDAENLYWVYRSAVMANERKGLVAAAPLLLGQIDFFDLQGNYLRSTHFERAEGLREGLEKMKLNPNAAFEPKVFITDLDANEDVVYGLSMNNLGKNIRNPELRSPSKILVFDWKGNSVKEFVLNDNRYVFSFAVDERNKRIYAFCPDESESNIVAYSYP